MNKNEPSNGASLLARILQGDSQAENELVKQYWRGLFLVLYKQTGDRDLSEDLAQDTLMLTLVKARQGLINNPDALKSFIRETGINQLIGVRRKEARRKTDPDSEQIELACSQDESFIFLISEKQTADYVRTVVTEIKNNRYRDLLHRHYLSDEDKASICQSLDLAPSNFDSVLHRARQQLKTLLLKKAEKDRGLPVSEILSVLFVFSLICSQINHVSHEVREFPEIEHSSIYGSSSHKHIILIRMTGWWS